MIRWRSERYDNLREYKREMGTSGSRSKKSQRGSIDLDQNENCSTCGFPKWQHRASGLVAEGVCREFAKAEG